MTHRFKLNFLIKFIFFFFFLNFLYIFFYLVWLLVVFLVLILKVWTKSLCLTLTRLGNWKDLIFLKRTFLLKWLNLIHSTTYRINFLFFYMETDQKSCKIRNILSKISQFLSRIAFHPIPIYNINIISVENYRN